MLSPENHKSLKALLLYQAVLHYLEDPYKVATLNEDEIESLRDIVLESFIICKDYKGDDENLIKACTHLLETKEDISKFCPKVNDIN